MRRTAIILFNDRGMETATRLKTLLSHAEIYGLEGRTEGTDKTFTKTAQTLQQLASEGVEIIGLCAAGILIRALAPILSDKRTEPPVIALADDGSMAVPLLGGLTGANELARNIAKTLNGQAAITASGSRRFGLQLEAPPHGYTLANPEAAKTVTSDILAGASVKLEGNASWLKESTLPLDDHGAVTLKVTPYHDAPPQDGLLFHPRTVIIALDDPKQTSPQAIEAFLDETNIARPSIAALLFPEGQNAPTALCDLARKWNAAIRYAPTPSMLQGIKIHKEHIEETPPIRIAITDEPIKIDKTGRAQGHLTVVGLGPGDLGSMTSDVREALFQADDLVGYETYLNLVPNQKPEQKRHASGNRVEIDRAKEALDLAATGHHVAVVSSGDPGIFAMAGAVMEAYEAEPNKWPGIDIEVLPGISAMQTAAARLGAPLGHDFCAISLSDIRKPWQVIEKRLIAAATADFVIALYNPASKTRREQITQARALLLQHRSDETVVILGRSLGRPAETITITTLRDLDPETIDMQTVLIIGSSLTRTFPDPGGKVYAYTPRTYEE